VFSSANYYLCLVQLTNTSWQTRGLRF